MICLERFRKGTHDNDARKEDRNYTHDQSIPDYNDKTMHQVESYWICPKSERWRMEKEGHGPGVDVSFGALDLGFRGT